MPYLLGQVSVKESHGHFVGMFPNLNAVLARLGYLKFGKGPLEPDMFTGAQSREPEWASTRIFASDAEHVEWTRTLLINGVGEFPQGIVPGDAYGPVLDAVQVALAQVRTTDGRPFVLEQFPDVNKGTLTVRINPQLGYEDRFNVAGEVVGASEIF